MAFLVWPQQEQIRSSYTAKLWDAETGQEIRTFLGHTEKAFALSVYAVTFSA
jgi:hypothetical protein